MFAVLKLFEFQACIFAFLAKSILGFFGLSSRMLRLELVWCFDILPRIFHFTSSFQYASSILTPDMLQKQNLYQPKEGTNCKTNKHRCDAF